MTIANDSVPREGFNPNANGCGRPLRVFVPDLLARWPWPRLVNPHYATVKKESDTWLANFDTFSSKALDAYNRCDFPLLACHFLPTSSKEHAMAGCGLMHVFFVFDEFSDRSIPSEVRNQKNIIIDALRNPHTPRPEGEWVGGELTRQFWEFTIQTASESMQKRFIQKMDEYLEGVVQESINKKDHHILDVESYMELRRYTAAANVVFAMAELEVDIPDEVMSHPAIQEMALIASDLVDLCNDVISYNVEQMRGDHLHNIITAVMHEYDTDINGAMLWVENCACRRIERFLAVMASLPQWEEPLNSQVKSYCDGMAYVVRGTYEWGFESERYFGGKGQEIKNGRWMLLLPKTDENEIGPMHIDTSLL